MKLKFVLVSLFCLIIFNSFAVKAQEKINDKSAFSYETHILNNDTLNYRLLMPKNFSQNKQYPVVLFLHGAGERGSNNETQLVHGSTLFLNEKHRDNFPAIVIFPQCPKDDYWSKVDVDRTTYPIGLKFKYEESPTTPMALVIDLLDKTFEKPFIKKDQVYVMGLSMGGMGTFEIIHRQPNMFAAAIPICGAGDPKYVSNYSKTLPVWIFHGAQDNVVDPQWSIDMASAILKTGGFPKFTLYDFANHNSWDSAFAEPELLNWLFSKTKQ